MRSQTAGRRQHGAETCVGSRLPALPPPRFRGRVEMFLGMNPWMKSVRIFGTLKNSSGDLIHHNSLAQGAQEVCHLH